jgi:CheY-like chemotaxis protein
VQPLANERGIRLSLEGGSDEGMYVAADRQRLKQVLLNLMSNAIKYNKPDGRVDVEYQVNGSKGVISIDDTGIGIAPDSMSQLFQPFHRLGAEASTVEGTGLGLALSKNLVTMMGGSIEVSSDETGSTFSVHLPIASVEEVEAPKPGDFISISEPHEHEGCKILYIEDNLTNLRLVERILGRRQNSSLLTSMQATLGIQLAKDHEPDLILMDLHLPDMSGEQALRILKQNPATRHIPVVMLTADATPGRAKRLKEQGAADYLTKPLDLAMFNQVIDRHAARPRRMAPTA